MAEKSREECGRLRLLIEDQAGVLKDLQNSQKQAGSNLSEDSFSTLEVT